MVIDIAAHISNLLYQNDCVNLPGLGRLFTQYQPAYIHHIEGIINPPSKSISFSEEIKEDNNALVNAISQSHHLNLLHFLPATKFHLLFHFLMAQLSIQFHLIFFLKKSNKLNRKP